MIYILLLTVTLLLFIAYYFFEKDIFSPCVIMCSTILLCVICAMFNIKKWGIDYHYNTYVVMVIGIISFMLPSIFVYYLNQKNYSNNSYSVDNSDKENTINIQKWKTIVVIIFNIITFIWYFKEVYRISILAGNTQGIAGMMSAFRMGNSYGTVADDATIPTILNQFIKFNRIFAYIYLYSFINNAVVTKKMKKYILYLIPVIGFSIQTILGSDRIYLIFMACSALVMGYVIWQRKECWNKGASIKFAKISIKTLIIVFVAFFLLRNVVGHSSNNNEVSGIDYITEYVGGSVQLFDMYMQSPIEKSELWGKESFSSVHIITSRLGITEPYKRHLEFRYSNGKNIGNVYGAFRKYYQDFGILGVIILQAIAALFYNSFYYYIKSKKVKRYADFSLLLYTFIVHCIFYIPIDDLTFSGLISMNYFTLIIYLRVIYWFLVEKRIIVKR